MSLLPDPKKIFSDPEVKEALHEAVEDIVKSVRISSEGQRVRLTGTIVLDLTAYLEERK